MRSTKINETVYQKIIPMEDFSACISAEQGLNIRVHFSVTITIS